MNLESRQISEKPKKVGNLGQKPIFQLRTKGGLYMLVIQKSTGYETLGTGPHRAVARHIATQHEPNIVWSDLSKSDHVDIEAFELILPKYQELTKALRDIPGKEDGQD